MNVLDVMVLIHSPNLFFPSPPLQLEIPINPLAAANPHFPLPRQDIGNLLRQADLQSTTTLRTKLVDRREVKRQGVESSWGL